MKTTIGRRVLDDGSALVGDTLTSGRAMVHIDDTLGTLRSATTTGAVQPSSFASNRMFDAELDSQADIVGTEGDDFALGGTQNNDTIRGLGGNDRLLGFRGDDVLDGGSGFDLVDFNASIGTGVVVDLRIAGPQDTRGEGFDTFVSIEGVLGSPNEDLLIGDGGANLLDGGASGAGGGRHDTFADNLVGGAGDDTYVVDGIRDKIFENAGEGFDTASSYNQLRLTDFQNVEAAKLLGAENVNVFGDALANTLTGNIGNNEIDGGAGADLMIGGLGDDSYFLENTGDVVVEQAGEGFDTLRANSSLDLRSYSNIEGARLLITATSALSLIGNGADNNLRGNQGDNYIAGLAGADIMQGQGGNDTYEVDSDGDRVIEFADDPFDGVSDIDNIQALVSFILPNFVENLRLFGTAIAADGNSIANTIEGNDLANFIDGRGGADLLIGYGGNDTYVVDNAGDYIVEALGGGLDSVQTTVSYILADAVENLRAFGSAGLSLDGNAQANLIEANAGNNRLDGRGGADYMIGYGGNDTYVVDNSGDYIVEAAGGGNDTAEVSASYVLPDAVENLRVFGVGDFSLDGNAQDNLIEGNGGANRIDGHAGVDTMIGYAGNDIYVVDAAGDNIVEGSNGGTDTVESTVSYVLPADIESLRLFGSANLSGDGNNGNNLIEGNTGSNRIDGRGGVDTMIGYAGNDTYVVDTAGDNVVEGAGAGTDTVESTISYALTDNVENLRLFGGDINGQGNALANLIEGTNGFNVIDGRGGADLMYGYGGSDTFVFSTAPSAGVATIGDFRPTADRIALDDAIFTAVGGTGTLAADAFVIGSAAADASDRIIYNQATGDLLYDADGNGAGAAIVFARVEAQLAITASDFVVV